MYVILLPPTPPKKKLTAVLPPKKCVVWIDVATLLLLGGPFQVPAVKFFGDASGRVIQKHQQQRKKGLSLGELGKPNPQGEFTSWWLKQPIWKNIICPTWGVSVVKKQLHLTVDHASNRHKPCCSWMLITGKKKHPPKKERYVWISATSKRCCLNPKGLRIGTPDHPFRTPWKIQVCRYVLEKVSAGILWSFSSINDIPNDPDVCRHSGSNLKFHDFSPTGIPPKWMGPRAAYKSQPGSWLVTLGSKTQGSLDTWNYLWNLWMSSTWGPSTTLQNKVFSNQNRGRLRAPGSWWSWSYLRKIGRQTWESSK